MDSLNKDKIGYMISGHYNELNQIFTLKDNKEVKTSLIVYKITMDKLSCIRIVYKHSRCMENNWIEVLLPALYRDSVMNGKQIFTNINLSDTSSLINKILS